jgi:hypothetical protein
VQLERETMKISCENDFTGVATTHEFGSSNIELVAEHVISATLDSDNFSLELFVDEEMAIKWFVYCGWVVDLDMDGHEATQKALNYLPDVMSADEFNLMMIAKTENGLLQVGINSL